MPAPIVKEIAASSRPIRPSSRSAVARVVGGALLVVDRDDDRTDGPGEDASDNERQRVRRQVGIQLVRGTEGTGDDQLQDEQQHKLSDRQEGHHADRTKGDRTVFFAFGGHSGLGPAGRHSMPGMSTGASIVYGHVDHGPLMLACTATGAKSPLQNSPPDRSFMPYRFRSFRLTS